MEEVEKKYSTECESKCKNTMQNVCISDEMCGVYQYRGSMINPNQVYTNEMCVM